MDASRLLSVCSKIFSAADGWRGWGVSGWGGVAGRRRFGVGVGGSVGSGRGGRPESIGSVMRWLGAR